MDLLDPATRADRLLRRESVVWLGTVGHDDRPNLVPVWFLWDGESVLIASKPDARKVRNVRRRPDVMLAVGDPEDDFDVGLIEARAELVPLSTGALLEAGLQAKYAARLAALGLSAEEFAATYSQVIRVTPSRCLPWHGRSVPASARPAALRSLPLETLAVAV